MENNWIHEEMGEDVEAISRRDRSIDSLDVDTEGSGVDAPDLDMAGWDDEVEIEDREDFFATKINFSELTDEDRELYLNFVSLRQELKEGSAEKEGVEDLNNLLKNCLAQKEETQDGLRLEFINLIIKKIEELRP